jgi:anti-anti-sigma regulatory factor
LNAKRKPKGAPPAVMTLNARATIARAPELHASLREWIEEGRPLVIDGSRIEEIDTASLQLLMAAVLSCQALSIPFGWEGASEPLRRAAAVIGVSAALGLDIPVESAVAPQST